MKEPPGSQSAITLKLNRLARNRVGGGWSPGVRAEAEERLNRAMRTGNLAAAAGRALAPRALAQQGPASEAVAARGSERRHLRDWPEVDGIEQRRLIALVILDSIQQGREVVYDWTIHTEDHFVVRDFDDILSLTFYNMPHPDDWHAPAPEEYQLKRRRAK